MPSKNATPRIASVSPEVLNAASSQYSGNASKVPTVPGAAGARPAPPPKATMCAGCRHMKRHDGAKAASGKMIVTPAHHAQRSAIGRAHDEARRFTAMRAHTAYAGHPHARASADLRYRVARGARRGKAQFVVIAAPEQRTARGYAIEIPAEHRRCRQRREFDFRRNPGGFEHVAEVCQQTVRYIDRAMCEISQGEPQCDPRRRRMKSRGALRQFSRLEPNAPLERCERQRGIAERSRYPDVVTAARTVPPQRFAARRFAHDLHADIERPARRIAP